MLAVLGVLYGVAILNAAEIKELRCEYRTNPQGIDIRSPRLSWVMQSERRGEMQTAYRVFVASSPDLLKQDKGDLWDSGKVESGQSTQIEYSGKPLASHQAAYWKVEVWDAKGGRGVSREPASWSMGLSSQVEWKAKWIGRDDARSSGPGNGNEKFLPATYLRKEFTLKQAPKRAVLYITSLGVAEPHLNGSQVGEDYLSPGWTDFNKRIYYRAYDVTARLKPGANVLGAILGDGWYRGHLSIIGQNIYGRRTRLLAQLHLFFADGSRQVIASDESWKGGFGPLLEADIYAGETYDARADIKGWDAPAFNDADWKPVDLGTSVNPVIQANPGEPVRKTGEIRTVAVTRPKPGLAVYDYGRNFSGWARLRIAAPSGTRIVMRFGEMLNPDGTVYRTNLRRPRHGHLCQQGRRRGELGASLHVSRIPVCRGGGTAGDRRPGNADRNHRRFGPAAGRKLRVLRCDHDANGGEPALHDPSEPCRAAYGLSAARRTDGLDGLSRGGRQHAVRTGRRHSLDEMDGRHGQCALPDGAFSMISPDVHHFSWSPGWADSGVLIPWTMYFVYSDTRLVSQHYHEIAGHLETYRTHSSGFVVQPIGLGDWLAPDMSTPKELIATALYARCAEVMATMARVLGKTQDAAAFADLHRSVRDAFQRKFVRPDGIIGSDSQGGYALAIAYDLLEPEQARQAADKLVAAVVKRNGHLSTGMVTTHLLLPALTKAGRTDTAYRLLAETTFPSWGYFLKMGATSMWERWDAKTEKGFHPDGMNSFNHGNLGTCTEWFYRSVLGIDAAEPGFGKILLKPEPGGNLTWARGYYDSPHGRVGSDWKIENGQFLWNVHIPANTTATVYLPATDAAGVTESGLPAAKAEGVTFLRTENGAAVYKVGSGCYRFCSGKQRLTKGLN